MPTTTITFGKIDRSSPALVFDATLISETLTPSAGNQQTAAVVPASLNGEVSFIANVATDTQIYVAFGANPNALTSTTARKMIPAGGDVYFIVPAGYKAAIVTAP